MLIRIFSGFIGNFLVNLSGKIKRNRKQNSEVNFTRIGGVPGIQSSLRNIKK